MKKKRINPILSWTIIIAIIILVAVCISLFEEKHNTGIKIRNGQELKDWNFINSMTLTLNREQLVIEGVASKDLKIDCTNVSNVIIKTLKQNEHKIYVFSTEPCTLNVYGDNELTWVSGWEGVTICGKEKKAKLLLSESVKGKILNLEDICVCAESFEADEDINIIGRCRIYAETTPGGEYEGIDARVQSGKNININLTSKGSIFVKADKGMLPFLAEKKILMSEENEIVAPTNGVVRGEDTPYGLDCYFVFDEEGNWDSDVLIKNSGAKP